jgi:hypothetical protein
LKGLLCGIESGFQEVPSISTGISPLEYGAACDQDFSACPYDVRDGVMMDSAVNFNTKAEPA